MRTNENPLFTLSIGQFMTMLENLVEQILNRKEEEKSAISKKDDQTKDEHFSIAQLCRFIGCSKATVHNYKKRGLPFFGIGRKILFRKSEVLVFMNRLSGKVKTGV